MSYLVLARKYRPETFQKVVGQEPIARTLQNALRTGRLAHAYLFTGPRGVGKTSMARILAKALRCAQAPTPEPCLACTACRAVASGHDLDVIEIDGASNRGIENIRDLRESVRYAATGGAFKVYIVDEVHQITQDAFNAFLKTLEEPPPGVVFVFATTEPRKVPETIRSRCQEFEFRRIPDAAIAAHVRDVCAGEGFDLAPGLDAAIARRARGGLRDALSLLDQLAAFGAAGDRHAIGHEAFQQLTGYLAPERVRELFDALVAREPARALDWLGEALAHGTAPADLLDQWLDHLRALLHQRVGSARAPELAGVAREALAAQAATFDETQLLGSMQVVIEARRALRDVEDERLVLEMALVELARIRDLEELRAALATLPAGRAAPDAPSRPATRPAAAAASASTASVAPVAPSISQPVAPPAAPPAAAIAAPAVALPPPAPASARTGAAAVRAPAPDEAAVARAATAPLDQRYEQLRAAVHKESPALAALLDTLVPVRDEGELLIVAAKPGLPPPALPHARLDEFTRRHARRLFGTAWQLRFQAEAAPRQPAGESDPARALLRQIREQFGGETVAGGEPQA